MKSLSASGTNTEQVDIQALRREDAKKDACERCGSWDTKQQLLELNVENAEERTTFSESAIQK